MCFIADFLLQDRRGHVIPLDIIQKQEQQGLGGSKKMPTSEHHVEGGYLLIPFPLQ